MEHTTGRILKIIITTAIIAACIYVLSLFGDLVRLLLISALLAYIMDPMACYLESRGLSRGAATLVIFLLILAVASVGVAYLVPSIAMEMQSVELDVTAEKASDMLVQAEKTLEDRLYFLGVEDLSLQEKVQELVTSAGDQLYSYFLKAGALLTNLLIIPFIMFFLLKDMREIKKKLISFVPNRYFEFSLSLLHRSDEQLGGYLRGTFIESLVIGILSMGALLSLDIKYAVLLALLAGLANMVPFIGPLVGAVPALLVAFLGTGDYLSVVYVALAYLIIQLIDNVVLKPLVVGRMVSLHPITVLLVVIVGGRLFGILGMFLSVPVAGIIKVIAEEAVRNFRKYRFV